jgi:hypothetical protein
MTSIPGPRLRKPSRLSRLGRHDPRRWDAGKGEGELAMESAANTEIEILLRVEIHDTIALWQAAARHLARCGLDMDDIDETIGPIEDPLIEACIATLTLQDGLAGCELRDIRLEQRRAFPVGRDQLPAYLPALPH